MLGNIKIRVVEAAELAYSTCGGIIGGRKGRKICLVENCMIVTHTQFLFAFGDGVTSCVFIEAGANSVFALP